MSAEITKAIRRLLAVYGEPKTDEPELLFEEFEKALTGMRADLLVKGVDAVIKNRAFSTWPTVGEVVQACRDASAAMADNYAPEHQRFPKSAPSRAVDPAEAKRLLDSFTKSMGSGNSFAEIIARVPREAGSTVNVERPWGEEVQDQHGNIVPIRKRSAA